MAVKESMTDQAPTVKFKVSAGRRRFSWTCTCGRRETGFKSSAGAQMSADGHCIVNHPAGSSMEFGGLYR